jgi:hypothetical protein
MISNAMIQALKHLARHEVEFVVVGGIAAALNGASRTTQDVDIVYRRNPDNFAKIVRALAPLNPYLRGAPPGLPFIFDEETLAKGLNFTLTTTLCDLDLIGEAPGGGEFDKLIANAEVARDDEGTIYFASLPDLIRMKRAAGRPKDFEALAELEILLSMQSGNN